MKSRARVLAGQAALFVLVLAVVVAIGQRGQRWLGLDGPVIAALWPLALSVLGPALSAWNRRVSAGVAIGVPLLSVLASHVLVWAYVAVATRADPVCSGPHSPCEGVGIFLAFYVFYAAATLAAAAVLAGVIRGIATLVARAAA